MGKVCGDAQVLKSKYIYICSQVRPSCNVAEECEVSILTNSARMTSLTYNLESEVTEDTLREAGVLYFTTKCENPVRNVTSPFNLCFSSGRRLSYRTRLPFKHCVWLYGTGFRSGQWPPSKVSPLRGLKNTHITKQFDEKPPPNPTSVFNYA